MNTQTQSQSTPSNIKVRRAQERGHADHGWLDSRHTFSFASYRDPRHMGFGDLRVINEDRVAPDAGFGTHGHRNMEIVSYPIAGALAHRDSTGTGSTIHRGEVQVMSAGQGIRHSEMNGSSEEPVHFLQIWILPEVENTPPNYQEKDFGRDAGVTLIVSPTGRDGSLSIRQDVDIHRVIIGAGESASMRLLRNRAWIQVVSGELSVEGVTLQSGDAAAFEHIKTLELLAESDLEALVFDLI